MAAVREEAIECGTAPTAAAAWWDVARTRGGEVELACGFLRRLDRAVERVAGAAIGAVVLVAGDHAHAERRRAAVESERARPRARARSGRPMSASDDWAWIGHVMDSDPGDKSTMNWLDGPPQQSGLSAPTCERMLSRMLLAEMPPKHPSVLV